MCFGRGDLARLSKSLVRPGPGRLSLKEEILLASNFTPLIPRLIVLLLVMSCLLQVLGELTDGLVKDLDEFSRFNEFTIFLFEFLVDLLESVLNISVARRVNANNVVELVRHILHFFGMAFKQLLPRLHISIHLKYNITIYYILTYN